MSSKEIIIISGSCSAKENWFDQIRYFEAQNFKVSFLDLDAEKFPNIDSCALHLQLRLEEIYASGEPEDKVIYAHSMGAMLLLKIFFQDLEVLPKFFSSKIVFIQVPLQVRALPYMVYCRFRILFLIYMFLYRYLIYFWMDGILIFFKRLIRRFKKRSALLLIFDLFLNLALMSNTSSGTRTDEFYNLAEYYKQWKNFDFQNHISEETKHRGFQNFYFTCGKPDMFEDLAKLERLVKLLNARLMPMPFGFHNPQHLFWWQQKLNEIALTNYES